MPSNYKTPGVYIEEIRKFPPSVAQVETAIPVFIGHTAIAKEKLVDDLRMKPKRITSMLEYETYFGKAQDEENIVVTIDEDSLGKRPVVVTADIGNRSRHNMYYSLQAFFAEGGGPCYIVSVEAYLPFGTSIDLATLQAGLGITEKVDEITLIVFPEAAGLASETDSKALQDASLALCAKLQDRFAVMDVFTPATDANILGPVDSFRNNGVGTNNLKYGAAYYPFLETIFDYQYEGSGAGVNITHLVDDSPSGDHNGITLQTLKGLNNAMHAQAKSAITQIPCVLPPSPLVVGAYANVDDKRGVWKAPANVSLASVQKPTVNISHEDQEGINVDVVAGKSVNAIRTFLGKGTIIWGARTLAGNDNEWRYVPVRRFFNMVEESVKKASGQFVFEPNDANTWVRVRAMIENFLFLQWRAGALQGATQEQAFYVRVGLGETMTALDILEGRMIIEIGMAVVRPAEFIILKFSHKMAEA